MPDGGTGGRRSGGFNLRVRNNVNRDEVPALRYAVAMRRLAELVVSDRLVMTVILINSVALLLVESFPVGTNAARFWHRVDYWCVVYFLVECTLKIIMEGWRAYWSSNWNRFDFILVAVSLPVLVAPAGAGILANVLLLRMGRLFRLFRLLRFIPNLDHLAVGIRRALRASVGVFLALFLANFILAVAATVLFRDADPEHFGTPFRSGYTLFQVFTVEGWNEVPEMVAEGARSRTAEELGVNHQWIAIAAKGFFAFAVVVGGILGLSLANAVFVDEMMMDNTQVLEQKVSELADEIRSLRNELTELKPSGRGGGKAPS
jgi:voltage-gated sodium channel